MVAIIIFAMAAIFLGLRLYAVLGSRTGHEQGFPRTQDPVIPPKPDARQVGDVNEPVRPARIDTAQADDSATSGLRAISAADRRFSLSEFIEGAQTAYRMILEGFWSGKLDEIADYVSPEVRQAFADAADAREAAGEVLDNRLIAIERAVITAASLDDGVARIAVRFDADIAAVTRDKEGAVIAGSLTDAIATHDVWTFERNIRSGDPNWTLVDTDEE